MDSTQVASLIRNLELAFADVSYPGDDQLTHSSYGEEPQALRTAFAGQTDWRQLDSGFLDQAPNGWASALSFFSGPALQFFLPAYLIADLRGCLRHQDPAFRLCHAVTPLGASQKISEQWGGGTMGDRARRDFARFTPPQVAAIVDYLWWKLEAEGYNPTLEQALEYYWLARSEDHSGATR